MIKSKIWEMKGDKYTKTLAKIQVRGIIHVSPKFIGICHYLCGDAVCSWAPTRRTETNRNIPSEFCYKIVNISLKELINIEVILFLIH